MLRHNCYILNQCLFYFLVLEVDNKIEDIQEDMDSVHLEEGDSDTPSTDTNNGSFMSESVYGKLSNSTLKTPKKHRSKSKSNTNATSPKSPILTRPAGRISMPILHEHFEPGTKISEYQTHTDNITSLDFDVPFGTMVTAALDDTVRVWDLSSGRCLGMLEGHRGRCIFIDMTWVRILMFS